MQFLADPEFDIQYNDQSGELTLTSSWVTYRVKTMAAGSEAVSRQYRTFSDWYAQLNALLNPGTRPPQARMILNEALDQRGRIPQQVQLELRHGQSLLSKRTSARSEHQLFHRLVESDRDRIAQTDQFLVIFQPVDFAQYQSRKSD
jgi:hypothetical protein